MLSEITTDSEEEWRADLQQIKDLGFNTVRTWVEWATCEPEPGKYNFDNLHLLMRIANETGLKVFIQIYVDSAPDWVAQNYPYALFEAQSGDKIYPQSAPGACTDNKAVEDAVLNFYSETAKVATAYPNFLDGICGVSRILSTGHLLIIFPMSSFVSTVEQEQDLGNGLK